MDENEGLIQQKKKRKVIWLSVAASLILLVIGWWSIAPLFQSDFQNPGGISHDNNPVDSNAQENFAKKIIPENPSEDNHQAEIEEEYIEIQVDTEISVVKNNQRNKMNQKKPQQDKKSPIDDLKKEDKDLIINPEEKQTDEDIIVAQNTKTDKGYKIIVKVKLKENKTPQKAKTSVEQLIAQEDYIPKRRKNKKLFGKKKDKTNKNKILGIDPEKNMGFYRQIITK